MYHLLYADEQGRMFDHELAAVGRTGDRLVEIIDEDVMELPPGASLVLLPESAPVGMEKKGDFRLMERVPVSQGPARAVGALLPQGYTRTLLPGCRRQAGQPLPLLGYAAVAWRDGRVYVAASRTDDPDRWDPRHYNSDDLPHLVRRRLDAAPENRVLAQLARCALEYSCYTAQNIFYTRWEGGLPVSPVCNARCLGCISLQPAECCPAPQSRLDFRPSRAEAAEVALHHLQYAPDAIISFGQGCEGEPALAAENIAAVIDEVRRHTGRGTVNMNSNAGYTRGVEQICAAGLDSIRVSLISAREEVYDAYYRPRDYSLADVARSINVARAAGVFVSLNLLVLPGLNDREPELAALVDFIEENNVNKVQLRNLNIDPDFFWGQVRAQGEICGIPHLIETLRNIPGLEVGNFSKPVKK
ncbi:radical SAM protein [Desulfoscipio geothermicus]|uniref:Radical SAM superfamily protein n=1 Tax=Desulfoscipio geothermicus DSM 3669 TaxID=1121426 RepID=A0A1I6CYD3_9FIRM|nr:radical SAM protein [Desulfoscipio geothermicus]SFQ98246.1 Radical SAM superfamily protein [Desulfoscipio geothermicus DSM 3669]